MKYLSLCSGIEAATVAWHPLGWNAVAFSEIEKFPSQVLANRYPQTPNYGDMTKFKEWPDADVDILVGGTPCQSFSVAGLRKGLADPRGNLMLTYLAIADQYRPRWLVWENVPGVLSSNGGRDFGTFLGGLGQLGYGFAYRVLDAQYVRVQSHSRAVPQRRRRVFVVGYLGDWRRAAAVLFERESLCRNTPPSRKAGEGVAGNALNGTAIGIDEECNASINHFGPLLRGGQGGTRQAVCVHGTQDPCVSDIGFALGRNSGQENVIAFMGGQGVKAGGVAASKEISPTLRSSDSGSNRTPCIAFGIQGNAIGRLDHNGSNGLFTTKVSPCQTKTDVHAVAFAQNTRDELREMEVAGALAAQPGTKQQSYLRQNMQVRRLTPLECERLQGFPDGYTDIPTGKGKAADGPRYKALGNSMAVNCMRWIGDRIKSVEEIPNTENCSKSAINA